MIQNRLIMAPMAGLTHVALRSLVRQYGGCGLYFTEMCMARTLPAENRAVSPVFKWNDPELNTLVCQVAGGDPDAMAEAARRIEAEGFFGVDINFGCSVAVICKQNAGAALLKEPKQAEKIVKAVRAAVSIPVLVKYRTGWVDNPAGAVDLAKRFEDAGADALTFHPRVAPDRRSRPPKQAYLGRVVDAVQIPVFGNGEVFEADDARRMLETTGCIGVSIGRIAAAKPWVFAQWTKGYVPVPDIYRKCGHQMVELLYFYFDPITAGKRFRKWALFFSASFQFGHAFCLSLCRRKTPEGIHAAMDVFFDQSPRVNTRPNMNLFR
ncbi:MAG: tRNA-dihydrouridine synthase family protein [Deltaproteobacteria bacterium]|nr:tRNA-dihydrouridine synthase family protein [Deltaproteobacteria bacterium]